jgi:two-component system chemotaxis response regulator CheY
MGKKILIVDDESPVRLILKKILSSHGYDIVGEAEDGEKALELYKKLNPDLVTMDLLMPTMDGLRSFQKITQYDSKAKIVILTALEMKAVAKQFIEAGAAGYIVKPLSEEKILATIEEAFKE